MIRTLFCSTVLGLLGLVADAQQPYSFTFGKPKAVPGAINITRATTYSDSSGYGFERVNLQDIVVGAAGFVTSKAPFYFSVKVPDGNYDVQVVVGDKTGTSDGVIRAECRRMMVNRVETKKGELKTVAFTLHIRDSLIRPGDVRIKLKPRESAYLHWDNKLTLELAGSEPKVQSILIKPSLNSIVTVFLAGNSTVVDQAEDPWAAWGQMIPAFFQGCKVSVANYAESGETLSSFIGERRFDKILSLLRPGDYVFAEFGHNDQKQKGEGIGAFTSYTKDLQNFVGEVKKRHGIPVLVTSVQRRSFDSLGKIMETLGDYPEANRRLAKQESIALIDLNTMSKTMYEAWGPEQSIKAFVHFPANTFPGQNKALSDNTHFTPFGAYEIARIVARGISDEVPALAKYFKPSVDRFDPAKPDAFKSFYWPYSSLSKVVKPDGN